MSDLRTRWLVGAIIAVANAGCATKHANDAVSIQGGTFLMGTAESAIPALRSRYGVNFPGSFENEIPEHTVTVAPFHLDRYEITNQRFSEFVAANPEWAPNGRYLSDWKDGAFPAGKNQHPVVFVTWHAAQRFCRWAGGRLPTEAEWEYAARGRGDSEFPWGNDLPTPDKANYNASKIQGTTAVGSYPPNSLGLYDMAGNVWEWTLDEWRTSYAEGDMNVQGRRVIRGASFGGAIINLRTRWRDSHEVSNAVAFVGFRCVYP